MNDQTRSILAGDRSPPDGYARRKCVKCGSRISVKRDHGKQVFVCPEHGNVKAGEVRR